MGNDSSTELTLHNEIDKIDEITYLRMPEKVDSTCRHRLHVSQSLELHNKRNQPSNIIPISCSLDGIESMIYAVKLDDEKDNDLFYCLGKAWDLFQQREYEKAFSPIYLLSRKDNPQAQFLLGKFYEFGLGKIYKDMKKAAELYTQANVNSDNIYLRKKAVAALNRTITISSLGVVDEIYKLESSLYYTISSSEIVDKEPRDFNLKIKVSNLKPKPLDEISKSEIDIYHMEYNLSDLKRFLKHLKRSYTYQEIAKRAGCLDKVTICKLTIFINYGIDKDYEDFWESLKKEFSKEFKSFFG